MAACPLSKSEAPYNLSASVNCFCAISTHRWGRSRTLVEATRAFNSSTVGSLLRAITAAARASGINVLHTRNRYRIPTICPVSRPELLFWLDGNQAMLRLPLLFRILPVGRIEEEVIICRRFFEVLEMIVGRGPQEVCKWNLRQKFLTSVERLDGQRIVLVLASGKGQVAVSSAQVRLDLHRYKKFLLRIGEFLLFQQRLA